MIVTAGGAHRTSVGLPGGYASVILVSPGLAKGGGLCYIEASKRQSWWLMELEIKQTADGTAIIVPAEVAERLRLANGDKVVLTEIVDGFMVSRAMPHSDRVRAATKLVMAQYAETLRELAK